MKITLIILTIFFSTQAFAKSFTCYNVRKNEPFFMILLNSKELADGTMSDEIIYEDGSRMAIKRKESGKEWEILDLGKYKGHFSLDTMQVTATKNGLPYGDAFKVRCRNVEEALAQEMTDTMIVGKLAASKVGNADKKGCHSK